MCKQDIFRPSRRQTGFSLLEMVVVIALIGTLIGVASYKLLPWYAEAERVSVAHIEGQLRSALGLRAAQLIAREDGAALAQLEASNPMALLLEPPNTYLGAIVEPTRDLLPARSWYFDKTLRRLVYRAGSGFGSRRGHAVFHEYAVVVEFQDADEDQIFSASADEFHGVRLVRNDLR